MRRRFLLSTLWAYCKRHAAVIFAVCLTMGIFAVVFSLYQLPVEAVAYAAVLTFAAFLLLGFFRFCSWYRRHKVLTALESHITQSIGELPAATDQIEEDYQRLLARLYEEYRAAVSARDRARTDMNDYYTLWAHQIKTPIAAMRLLLESERPAYADELLAELFRIEQYVEMVLQYLRVESLSSDLVVERVDVHALVRETIHKYAKTFIRKKLRLTFEDCHCIVLTDEKWLSFVIEQVLSNALKYTREGGISIYLDPKKPKTLVIEDTGIGIAPEDLPRVCERGYTGYNGRADKKSTGIGLYLCKRIMTRLSHTFVVESEAGKGTRVSLGLDSAQQAAD